MKRTGMLAKKVGMTRIFCDSGKTIPVTVLDVNDCIVTNTKSKTKDGYSAVQIGFGSIKAKNVNKPQKGYFDKNKVAYKRNISEFKLDNDDALLTIGDVLSANHFVVGQKVDARGFSIGKGFAGPMKRHNFRGLEASHGVSISHRAHGSTGQCQDPGKVFKNKKMAGHLGDHKVTIQNLEVAKIDDEKGLLFVKGNVPGAKNSIVKIFDAVKSKHKDLPFPAMLKNNNSAAVEEQSTSEENNS